MTTPSIHRSLAVLKLPTSVPALISVARAIVQTMTGNGAFPSPQPALVTVGAAIDALVAAEVAAHARTRGAAAARNRKRAALIVLLDQLKGYVQTIADADPEHAPALIQSAAMAVKHAAVRTKRVFAAKQGSTSGSVILVAPAAAHRASYEWEYSADGGTSWQGVLPTLKAHAGVSGLQPGTNYAFRYRSITRAGVSDWSQPVSLYVK